MNKFLSEILEQPLAIQNLLDYYRSEYGKLSLIEAEKLLKENDIQQVVFTGMGSSFFISHAASGLFNEMNILSFVINTSELLHYNLSILNRKTLLVCISQSGESFEIREILRKLPDTVCSIGIMNEENSTLAKNANVALFTKGGKEEMTSTKTYVLTSLVTYILAHAINNSFNNKILMGIEQLKCSFTESLKEYKNWLNEIVDFLGDLQTIQIIARGPSFSTACQSALMFKEALQIPAAGILGGEFRHGPMEMVNEGFKSILFIPKGRTQEQSVKMAKDIVAFGGKVLVITNEKLYCESKNMAQFYINQPDEYLFSIQSILPVQLFVDEYAKTKGYEAGSFSKGAKVTEIE
ncbi:MAG TPA: SIS domain-containing protein [Bacteroidales bacterium]|nr:SIS domain-containing protein [Bacteroidales bacterium]HQG76428.1 SIS domain-containing protein [Bacteroidales bacterium]